MNLTQLPNKACDKEYAGKPCTGNRSTRFDEGSGVKIPAPTLLQSYFNALLKIEGMFFLVVPLLSFQYPLGNFSASGGMADAHA